MSIVIARTPAGLKKITAEWRNKKLKVGFVPTMGALHQGHLSLIKIAREHADKVIVSIFVNPTQFAPHEDFAKYPRHEKNDVAILEDSETDVVYLPGINDIYPIGAISDIKAGTAAHGLESDLRPTHFDGVVSVVARLFKHTEPDVAVFGEKDYQQLCVIRQMVHDLHMPVDIIAGPIVRDAQGLALSSRNAYLSAEELAVARQLNKILFETADSIRRHCERSEAIQKKEWIASSPPASRNDDILQDAREKLSKAGFDEVQYLELRNAETLAPLSLLGLTHSPSLSPLKGGEGLRERGRLLAAVKIGKTRLIDNVVV